jgi:tetraacyldisaccharide 4'-kinase
VICIGNATVGGVGKTPFAIALKTLLSEHIENCAFLTRGYGGREKGPLRVDPNEHDASDVGDEALLLAQRAPTWISRNRRDGAQEAARAGARAIIMDDGFQNPTIAKTVSILLIDGEDPGGNGKIFPAGPLREPLARAKSRADIVVIVGQNRPAAEQAAAEHGASFAAWLKPAETPTPERVVAFSGIGRPQKFFASLRAAGFEIAKELSFPDHYVYSGHDQRALEKLARKQKARLVTTEKDHVRLHKPFSEQVRPFRVAMEINRPEKLVSAILRAIDPSPCSNGAIKNG